MKYSISFPCKEGVKIPVGEERAKHIKQCAKCQELIKRTKQLTGVNW